MVKGDIVSKMFSVTDLIGSKLRPVVVLADTTPYVTFAFITAQLKWHEPTNVLLKPTLDNGLIKTSLI